MKQTRINDLVWYLPERKRCNTRFISYIILVLVLQYIKSSLFLLHPIIHCQIVSLGYRTRITQKENKIELFFEHVCETVMTSFAWIITMAKTDHVHLIKFNGKNFQLWKQQIKHVLKSYELLSFVTGVSADGGGHEDCWNWKVGKARFPRVRCASKWHAGNAGWGSDVFGYVEWDLEKIVQDIWVEVGAKLGRFDGQFPGI